MGANSFQRPSDAVIWDYPEEKFMLISRHYIIFQVRDKNDYLNI